MATIGWGKQDRSPAVPVMVAAGIVLSLAVFLQVRDTSREVERAVGERQAAQFQDALNERLDRHILLLRALSGPLAGPAPVTRSSFATASEPLLPLYPSLRVVAWARRITGSQIPLWERVLRSDGRPGFSVRIPADRTVSPDQEMFINVLAESATPTDHLLGEDIGGRPASAALLARACRTGEVVAVPDGGVGTGSEGGSDTTILLPVYNRDIQPEEGDARCGALSGYLWATFRLDQVLRDAAMQAGLSVGDAYLVDAVPAVPRILAVQPGVAHRATPFQALSLERLEDSPLIERGVDFAGRSWRLLVVPCPSPLFDTRDRLAWGVLLVGLLLTGGLAGYVRREARAKRLLQTEAQARAAMGRALRESEERFRLALRHSRVALFSQDRDLRYLWIYSPQTAHMPEDFIGRTHADVFDPGDAAVLDAIKRTVLDSGVGVRREIELTTAGRPQMFDLSVEPMQDDTGRVSGVICAAIDVTESSEIRRALHVAHAEAERANQAKSRFLAAASHDLRQPFQAMSLFHHILVSKLTDPQQLDIATKLGEALTAGNTLLSTLLDTSALEAGTVTPRVTDFEIQDVVSRLATEISDQALDHGLSLRVVPSSLRVRSDPILLERMLRNLLVNALRYTVQGRILMGCRRRADRLLVEVWDTGPGIPADQMTAIFEDFYRCGTDQRDSTRGLGLGLSIVRRTGQILDHPVAVRSRVGCGTVFSVSIPLAPREDRAVAAR